jgi:hypothetical protein
MAESSDRDGCALLSPVQPLTSPQPTSTPSSAEDRGRLLQELVRALDDDLGGFQLLDQELALVGDSHLPSAVADLVGLDRTGRLVLVLQLTDPSADVALAQALDLAALADARQSLLERHFARTLSSSPCLVVLVGAELPEELVRRVRVVGPARLRLLEARVLRSASGITTSYFPAPQVPASGRLGDVEGFLGALPGPSGERAAVLVERLRRLGSAVDSRLGLTRTGDGLEWRIGATTLCTLGWRGDELVGRVGGGDGADATDSGPFRALSDGGAMEAFLDAALGRFLALAAGANASPKPARGAATEWARN